MPSTTIADLAADLEKAINFLTSKKSVLDKLKNDLKQADDEFTAAATIAVKAREAYLAHVNNLLSLGGTVHR